jgi:hypothetical protein
MNLDSTDALAWPLKASINEADWPTYKSSLRQFLLGRINQAELSASIDPILSTPLLVNTHNRYFLGLYARVIGVLGRPVEDKHHEDNTETPISHHAGSRKNMDLELTDDFSKVQISDGEISDGDSGFNEAMSDAVVEDETMEEVPDSEAEDESMDDVPDAEVEDDSFGHDNFGHNSFGHDNFGYDSFEDRSSEDDNSEDENSKNDSCEDVAANPPAGIQSDGDPNHQSHHRNPQHAASAEKVQDYVRKLQKKWLNEGGDPGQEISIPAGYRLIYTTRNGGTRNDYVLLGHPRHIVFRSYVEFYPHLKHLIRKTNDATYTGRCTCKAC